MARMATDTQKTPAFIAGPRLLLLLVVLALLLFGLVMVYSTTSVLTLLSAESVEKAKPMEQVFGQMKYAIFGVVLAVAVWKFLPPSLWRGNFIWVLWALSLALLIITALMGAGSQDWGARRWLTIGSGGIQPSEFSKIALVLVAARLFNDFREGAYKVSTFFVLVFVLLILPILIIFGPQSDLGTAIICAVGILAVMWLGEVPLRTMLIICGLVAVFGLIGVLASSYRRERLMVFLNPWNDGQGGFGRGFQIIHSMYAIAGGGIFGMGLGNSHEKYLYLTQSDTDFIFSIIGEELGLLGACAIIVLFILFLYAGLRIARAASDNFDAMVAGGFTVMIVFQAFLNIAMAIGWFPPVGNPLPFISLGGSSRVASLIMVGFILLASRNAAAPTIYDRRRADLRLVRMSNAGAQEQTEGQNARSYMSDSPYFPSRRSG